MANDAGSRMVSALSQGQMAAIVNPGLNGWFGLDGAEINDNGCLPFGIKLDTETVGSASYWLQREFNNAGAIESDPNAPACTPRVDLKPTFVVPSAVNRSDVVQFDGSTSVSSLMVSKDNYVWSFGDGTGAIGPSVVHSYGAAGTYSVALTVKDRGAHVATISQTITVLGAGGQPPPPPPPPPNHHPTTRMQVRIQLLPQGLHAILRDGIALRVSSNEPADGVSRLTISKSAAKSAHLRTGRASSVVVGRGTIAGIKDGVVRLHLHLSRTVAAKLGHLRHLKLTVHLALMAASGDHTAIDAAGSY
jgi:hypothetical protein